MSQVRTSSLPASLVSLGLIALPLPALAFHPLITDDTGTQGTGGNQLELGYDYAKSKTGGVSETAKAVPFTYTRGITDALDLFAGIARQTDPVSGWTNVGVGAKWRFHEDDANKRSVAVKPEIILPVSRADEAKGLGNGETSWAVTLILTQETGFGAIHANAAVEHSNFADSSIDDRKTVYRLSVAPVWAVAEGWNVALDVGVQTNPDRSQDAWMGYAEVGVVYSPSDNFDLSLGVIRDLRDGPVETTSATFGMTWRF